MYPLSHKRDLCRQSLKFRLTLIISNLLLEPANILRLQTICLPYKSLNLYSTICISQILLEFYVVLPRIYHM